MLSWSKSDDRVAIAQMNSELRNAQLELLSAECATDRLRLRFSAEEVARYGHQDVVRKAVASAAALHEYYGNIVRHLGNQGRMYPVRPLPEGKVEIAIELLRQYLEDQRRRYRPQGSPLNEAQHVTMKLFFPCGLLPGIRLVELQSEHVPDPPFYPEARAMGVTGLPEVAHMASMTFQDVLVFPGGISDRRLFHALVHAVQFKALGLERYAELFVRSFLRTRNHASVPLEMHAFGLEVKFAEAPENPFSVEEMVRLWANQGRY
jgi:hypothetical protein